MADRLVVDTDGVSRAAGLCWSTAGEALEAINGLLNGLSKGAVEAAAGNDDYGRQITDGWAGSGAENFPEFNEGINTELNARGTQMAACRQRVIATDADVAQQVKAVDLGIEYTNGKWSPIQPDEV